MPDLDFLAMLAHNRKDPVFLRKLSLKLNLLLREKNMIHSVVPSREIPTIVNFLLVNLDQWNGEASTLNEYLKDYAEAYVQWKKLESNEFIEEGV